MRRVIVVVCVLSLVVAGVVFAAQARVLQATEYQALGCANIVGWDWLRATDARVTWTFPTAELRTADLKQVYLNFAGLVTNGTNGGAGYDARLKFYVFVPGSDVGGGSTVKTVNPFRPQHSANSHGVGYQVYGHGGQLSATLLRKAIAVGSLKATLVWGRDNVVPINRHIAAKKNSLSLGYTR